MKPKPFASLNHFTVPVDICSSRICGRGVRSRSRIAREQRMDVCARLRNSKGFPARMACRDYLWLWRSPGHQCRSLGTAMHRRTNQMSESGRSEGQSAMTQVVVEGPDAGPAEVIGEFQSAGLRVGWTKATLSQQAHAALREILERAGGAVDRLFELRHGAMVLLRCKLVGDGALQLSFEGTRRRRIA